MMMVSWRSDIFGGGSGGDAEKVLGRWREGCEFWLGVSILFKDEIDRGRGQRCRQSRRVEEKQLKSFGGWIPTTERIWVKELWDREPCDPERGVRGLYKAGGRVGKNEHQGTEEWGRRQAGRPVCPCFYSYCSKQVRQVR